MKTSLITLSAIVAAGFLSTAKAQTAQLQTPQPQTTALDARGPIVVMPPYQVRSDVPQPIKVLPLNLGREFAGMQFTVKFRVDTKGHAYDVDIDTYNHPDRYTNVKTASAVAMIANNLAGWQFEPAHDANGRAIDRAVIMPVNAA